MATFHKKRVRLSFLAARAQKLLFWVLCGIAFALGCMYLFLMNRVAMQGYVLSKVTQQNATLASDHERLEAQIARFQTREYILKMSEKNLMIGQQRPGFITVKQNVLTAQR